MKTIKYTTPEGVRKELQEFKGISGCYTIRYTGGQFYVGQSQDLYKRLRGHVGNMDPRNKGTRAEKKIRELYFKSGSYIITVYECPEKYLNVYEQYLQFHHRANCVSTISYNRERRDEIPKTHPADFKWIKPHEWDYFLKAAQLETVDPLTVLF